MLERIKASAIKNAAKIAYIVNNKSITYSELWQRAEKYGQLLKKQGSGSVIVYGHKSVDMLVSMLSCIVANRPYIPVDTYMPISRINSIIENTGASLMLCNEEIETDIVITSTLQGLESFACEKEKEQNNDIVYMIFTSGSTGNAKGVPISNANLINFTDWISNLEPLSDYSNINVLNQASFSFDLSVADIYYALCNGHTLVAMERSVQEDLGGMFEYISDNRISLFVVTPTFIKLCLLNKDFNSNNFPYLKCIYFCGEQLEKDTVVKLFERFEAINIINAYGPTEATSAVSACLITRDDIEANIQLLPVGRENTNATDITIEDNEIVLHGKSVFGGYLGGIIGGYYLENCINHYRTGDIGFYQNGKLYCKGRKDSQIKFKGYRIELNDIESNIKLICGVVDAAVVAKYNNNNIVKAIKAFVVIKGDITAEHIKAHLKNAIPHYMIPAQIKIINALPMNDNKKIDRRRLSQL